MARGHVAPTLDAHVSVPQAIDPPGAPKRPPRTRLRLALTIAGLVLLTVVFVVGLAAVLLQSLPTLWAAVLAAALFGSAGLVVVLTAFFAVALSLGVAALFRNYVQRMNRFTDAVQIILAANPSRRLGVDGPSEAAGLAAAVNALADRCEGLEADVEARVRESRAELEQERHRLAALMSELAEGVLVCNQEGLILLYNAAARALFEPAAPADAAPVGLVGLGRSVFGIIDRELIAHAFDLVSQSVEQGAPRPISQFVTNLPGGRMIRAQMAPVVGDQAVPAGQQPISGFVLTLDDVTASIVGSSERDELIASLAEEARTSLASIRAAVEAIVEYDSMDAPRREQFIAIIRDEAVRLSDRLDVKLAHYSGTEQARWPLEDMRSSELLQAIRRNVVRASGIEVHVDLEKAGWLCVDSFAVVQACAYLARRLQARFGVQALDLDLVPAGRFLRLELVWPGEAADVVTVAGWDAEPFAADAERGRLTLRDVAVRHGGEQWVRADRGAGTLAFCLLMPMRRSPPADQPATSPTGRPEFYDFDLFHRPGLTPELQTRRLAELAYTVFDTETTGLDPSGGDEIISLSAVRIVNGRLLRSETFDHLVDPRRAVSRASMAIHGITPAMLEGQPTIDAVLARFARFAEDTVLVGHNVAFDMRFLEIKEGATGIRFLQPVLDTLLLSAVAHAGLEEHGLEASARRYGIAMIGRHTALGDAIVTAEIFMKLIPLLESRGIATLREALEASQRTFFARLKY
ncbi:MAG: exonuclease domain-containing protein [Casimicrobiaceae bacterium]